MNEDQLQLLTSIKKLTSIGFIAGITLFISNFFVSGISQDYFLFIGIGVMVSSMVLFGFGMFIALMQEVNDRGPRVSRPAKPRLYLVKNNKPTDDSRKLIS